MKMILVDDDPLIRTAIRSMVDWDELGITVEGEASNGAEALALCGDIRPDIVVTDIKMPVMDGLLFIQRIIELHMNPVIVVLSCYDEFALVRQAFKLGVFDYVLKPEMEEVKLTAIFRTIAERSRQAENSGGALPRAGGAGTAPDSRRTALQDFFQTLLGAGDWSDSWAGKQAKALRLRISPGNLVMCLVGIADIPHSGSVDEGLLATSAVNIIEAVLSEFRTGEVFPLSEREYAVMLSFAGADGSKSIHDTIMNVCTVIINRLEKYMNLDPAIAVSTVKPGGFECLQALYRECISARGQLLMGGRSKIHFYQKSFAPANAVKADLSENLKKLRAMLETNQLEAGLRDILIETGDSAAGGIDQVRYAYDSFITLIGEYANKNIKSEEISRMISRYHEDLKKCGSLDEMNARLRSICSEIIRYQEVSNRLVVAAKSYILSHFNEPISLENAACALHISKEHLSRVFAEKTNSGFTKYLMEVRAEKAKELMATGGYKIYEVAEKVGYSSTEYFSKMFKTVTGLSPKEYENKVFQAK